MAKNTITFNTPPGTAIYPHLKTPSTKFDATGKYSVKLRWPTEVIAPLVKTIDDVTSSFYTDWARTNKKAAAKASLAASPFQLVYDDNGELTGETEATFSMKAVISWTDKTTQEPRQRVQRPVLVDAQLRPTQADPWTGSQIAVNFEANPGYWSGQQKIGTSLRLNGAQIIKLVSSGGAKSAEEMGFGVYDDGFNDAEFQDQLTANTYTSTNALSYNDEDDEIPF